VNVRAIVTAPPYAPFLEEVARHPLVAGLRLNTVMPLKETPGEALRRLSRLGPPLWVDLKGRQLRVVGAAIPPFTEVRLSHPVQVRTPALAYFSDGREPARIAAVEGDRLILEEGPHRLVGPGESVNIVDPTLRIQGTLTDLDRQYLAAMAALGLRRVMLSFVEEPEDVLEVKGLLPEAEVILKIESARGLDLVRRQGSSLGRLMAARGDLYVEVQRPHRIVSALRAVVAADPEAVVASRLFTSLARGPVPEAADIGDAAFLMALGYRTFMLGDEVCLRRESVLGALNLLEEVAQEMGEEVPACA
jgi:pyruvate kinase